jgi:hypothetical protein
MRHRNHKYGNHWVYILDYEKKGVAHQVSALIGCGAGRVAEYDESVWAKLYARAGIK